MFPVVGLLQVESTLRNLLTLAEGIRDPISTLDEIQIHCIGTTSSGQLHFLDFFCWLVMVVSVPLLRLIKQAK